MSYICINGHRHKDCVDNGECAMCAEPGCSAEAEADWSAPDLATELIRELRDAAFVGDDDEGWYCHLCGREHWRKEHFVHASFCPVPRATAHLEQGAGKGGAKP